MLFADVIGQLKIKQHLLEMVQQNRLSHALLFLGKEGSGALPLALAFAQYVVCTSAKAQANSSASLFGEVLTPSPPSGESLGESDSCGGCPACTKADKLVHPDIHF